MSTNKQCKNPACNNTYSVAREIIDDGYCTYMCWEKVNCKVPEKKKDSFDIGHLAKEMTSARVTV